VDDTDSFDCWQRTHPFVASPSEDFSDLFQNFFAVLALFVFRFRFLLSVGLLA